MLPRALEPEVMDTADEARDYDAMDHEVVNATFCEDLLALGAVGPRVLDVGTGTARIPIELCRRDRDVRVVAIDLAEHMLAVARRNVAEAGLDDRITLERVDAKDMPYEDGAFSRIVSNSIVHHIPEPRDVFGEMLRVLASGGIAFVRDLVRPPSEAEVARLVTLYSGTPPTDRTAALAFEHQRELFRASLCAGLTVAEVEDLARAAGMAGASVAMTSDRHWTLVFRKP